MIVNKQKIRLWFWRVAWTLLCAGVLYAVQPYHVYRVTGSSMEPTLKDGSVVWVKRGRPFVPKNGHIYVFRHYGELIVKRVVAVPGNVLPLVEGADHQYTITQDQHEIDAIKNFGLYTGSYVLHKKQIYVLGDNLLESTDSRFYGFLSTDEIEAEVLGY